MSTVFETFLSALASCRDHEGILGEEIVIFPPTPDFGYWATPKNGLTFGAMGVDGVHYVILTEAGRATDAMPVIYVSPMDFTEPYAVYAETFRKFLALACGVSVNEIDRIVTTERRDGDALIPFLRANFRLRGEGRVALLDSKRQARLADQLERIERKPNET